MHPSLSSATNPREVLAGVRVLVCVARADGQLEAAERDALEAVLTSLPAGTVSVSELLASDIDLDHELALLTTPGARHAVYDAAMVLACADGAASPQELALLERIEPPEAEPTLLGQLAGETRETLLPTRLPEVHDPELRRAEIQEDTLKYAILSAGLGAVPVPGAAVVTDLMVVGLQVKLVRDIGCYWGHALDRRAARTLVASMVGSAGLRIAINNVARLIPGWGSALGAATSFAATVAVGRAADAYFASGATLTPEALRAAYDAAVVEGKAAYAREQALIAEARSRNGAAVAELVARRAQGELAHDAFLRALEAVR